MSCRPAHIVPVFRRSTLTPYAAAVLAAAPTSWVKVPKVVYGYPGAEPDLYIRWPTIRALERRGLIQIRLRGRPRASWQWRVAP